MAEDDLDTLKKELEAIKHEQMMKELDAIKAEKMRRELEAIKAEKAAERVPVRESVQYIRPSIITLAMAGLALAVAGFLFGAIWGAGIVADFDSFIKSVSLPLETSLVMAVLGALVGLIGIFLLYMARR